MMRPADQAARDRIATSFHETLFVEAGAGTGKTSSLVTRIVGLVGAGVELQHIAAITFTEAAAAELRDRIRSELEKALREGRQPVEHYEKALRQIDSASISTLHSFAQRILALYPLEAGLPPRIEILDEVRARIQFDERWRNLLDELLSDERHGLPIVQVLEVGLTVPRLREIALELHQRWDRLEDVAFPAGGPKLELDGLFAALDELNSYRCSSEEDRLRKDFDAVQCFGKRLREATTDDERLAELNAFKSPKPGNAGSKKNWNADPKDVREAIRAVGEEVKSCLLAYHTSLLMPILERLRRFVLDYAAERRVRGTLEFHDLLVLARDLLRRNEHVRRAVAARYRALLIDEFQDTDPIQLEIAALLATAEHEVGDRPWYELPITPGRLFFVGDPKQSIYRFRGADIALYTRARETIGAAGIALTQNFRTVRRIVDWVNAVFERVIARGAGDAQPRYEPLHSWRQDVSAALPVVVIGGPRLEFEKVHELRRAEAEELVRAIRTVKEQGWMVADRDTGQLHPARYQDIAVLLPARTALPWLERELEAQGVPYRIVSRSLLYRTQEVRDLTNILAAIDDPTDQVSVVAALRSPAFACRDDELYEWSRARGHWNYQEEAPASIPEDHPVRTAMDALRDLHQRRWWLGLNELVETVIRERCLFEVAFAHRRPRERWQRLRFVLDQARAFADNGGTTLREFVEWLRQQDEEDVMVTDTVVAQDDDDAVRIMTIHAAKGLEFPVVVLAGLNVGDQGVRSPLLWPEEGPPEVRIGSKGKLLFCSEGFDALAARERMYGAYEKLRLLYVGATRARDHLLVSLFHKPPKNPGGSLLDAGTHAELLWRVCQEIPGWRELPGLDLTPGEAPGIDEPPADDGLDEQAWVEQRQERIARAASSMAHAATEIARTGEQEPGDDAERPWRAGRAATNIGRAVHATLQAIDIATGEGLETAARAQAAAEGIPWAANEVARLAAAALRAPSVQEAVQGRYWREVYVGAPAGDAVVEGFIDLLYETPEGLVVVDYKTDRVESDEDIDRAMEHYRLQGAVYALALRNLAGRLGRPVVRCTFVFLRGSEPQERHVEDLPAAIAEAESRLAASNRRLA